MAKETTLEPGAFSTTAIQLRKDLFYTDHLDIQHYVGYTSLFLLILLIIVSISVYEAKGNVHSIEILVSLILRLAAAFVVILTETPILWLFIIPALSPSFIIAASKSLLEKFSSKKK